MALRSRWPPGPLPSTSSRRPRSDLTYRQDPAILAGAPAGTERFGNDGGVATDPGAVVRSVEPLPTSPPRKGGLTSAEVRDRVERGLVNGEVEGTGRSVADILRANIFTR